MKHAILDEINVADEISDDLRKMSEWACEDDPIDVNYLRSVILTLADRIDELTSTVALMAMTINNLSSDRRENNPAARPHDAAGPRAPR